MLELKNIVKHYIAGDTVVAALKGVNIKFDRCEFVSVLGPSGCGKTTLLNIIGGLDRYTSGDLIINGRSTKDYKDADWDSYRNNSVGFVFQNYNLIPHLSVVENVELALTLSGMPEKERRVKAEAALYKVGLSDQIEKRPNQLSGGQMQRVAIARALVNDPDIILADEPTGALDSVTSVQIMELLKKIAGERLIIMVTHNSEIANKYSTRKIQLLDGEVMSDTESAGECAEEDKRLFGVKKSSMSFLTSLKLSFRNLLTKRARTILTAFAGSIGIIGIALVLAISTGFTQQVKAMETDNIAAFPLTVNNGDTLKEIPTSMDFADFQGGSTNLPAFPDTQVITIYDDTVSFSDFTHKNVLTEEYTEFVQAMDPSLYDVISYSRNFSMNLAGINYKNGYARISTGRINWQEIIDNYEFLGSQYDVLEGKLPENTNELVLIVDKYNRLSLKVAGALGLDTELTYTFADMLGKTIKYIPFNVYYTLDEETQLYGVSNTVEEMYNDPRSLALDIVGIVRINETSSSSIMNPGIAYTSELMTAMLNSSANSAVALAQTASEAKNVVTGFNINNSQYVGLLKDYGVIDIPEQITIYPSSMKAKAEIKAYLDGYNSGKAEENKILYLDISDIVTSTMGMIIDTITYILVAFAAISLLVSSIMIGIITYISVLERTKEIGVLRSLGARKKDIARVFNAETLLVGLTSGFIGVFLAWLITLPINAIISNLVPEFSHIAILRLDHAILLILISMSLTLISGLIPSRMASKKDPVIALRTE